LCPRFTARPHFDAHMKAIVILLLIVTGCVQIGCTAGQRRAAGIYQFVEERNGQQSVWGIDIQLANLSFLSEVRPDEIELIEGKYGKDLKSIMVWTVSSDRKCIRFRFQSGCGDFGTGNAVAIKIQKSAIVGYRGPDNRFEWSIGTDMH
jgi:hypothetical protein